MRLLLLARPPALFPGTDNTWYDAVACSIEDGHLGRLPAVGGGDVLSIRFPPAYPYVLALGRFLLFWVDSFDAHLWTGAALGALAAATVAALVWRLTRHAPVRTRALTTIAAGLLFALNPNVVGASVSLMAEALVLPVVALVLLVVDRLVTDDARRWEAVALGALLALGALTRSEAIVVLAAAVVGGYVVTRASSRTRAAPWAVALAIGFAVAIAWSAIASVAAERPVVMGTNSGSLLLGANCPVTRTADGIGYWSVECLNTPSRDLTTETARRTAAQAAFLEDHFALPPQIGAPGEAEISGLQTDAATDEIVDHPVDTVAAVPVRLLRGLGLYWSPLQDSQEVFEGRNHSWEVVGRWFNIVLVLPFALLTLVAAVARRSRIGARLRGLTEARRLVPSLALMTAWALTIAASYGSARFRAAIEPSLAVFAALGIAIVVSALGQRGRTEAAS